MVDILISTLAFLPPGTHQESSTTEFLSHATNDAPHPRTEKHQAALNLCKGRHLEWKGCSRSYSVTDFEGGT